MTNQTKIHVGLEIGTSKTCFVVGEDKPGCAIRILGVSVTESAGVKEGEICDPEAALVCLKDALTKAENASDVNIGSVFLTVTGEHIQGINSIGAYQLPDEDSEVTADHIKEVFSIAREAAIPKENACLHSILRGFRLDGTEYNTAPIAIGGKTIDADLHIIHGNVTRIMNSMSLVKKMGLEIDDIVFAPIATAQIALDSQLREKGALLLDIGGGTTEYALYLNGKVTVSGCIPEGGVHVTHDIQIATGLPFSKAELLKVIEGDVSGNPEKSLGTAVLTDEKDAEKLEVQRTMLNEVIRQRVEKILKSVRSSLPDGALDSIGAGVFVTGGTSQMQGFIELAADVFGPNINRISPPQFSGIQADFEDPRCFTALGLIRYAQIMLADQDHKTT